MNKINVMHIVRPASGGMKLHVLSLLENLDNTKYKPILVCPREVIKSSKNLNFKVINLDIPGEINYKKDWLIIKELQKIMQKNNAHIVHTHGAKAGMLGRIAAWKAGVPVKINTVHNFIYDNSMPFYYKYPLKLLQSSLNKTTDAQIAVSNELKKQILRLERCSPKKIFTVYNGIDLNEYKFLLDCSKLKEDLGIDMKSPVIGVISRLIPQKGIDSFLKAAYIISSELPEVKFIIAGEGPYEKQLKKRAHELKLENKIKFLGYIPHVPSFLPLFNVIVIPSLSEGLCISAIEAMAARRPVVAYSVGGLPEVIDDFENGFLVEKGDFVALAEKIMILLNERDAAEHLGAAARIKVEKNFDLKNMILKTESIYEKLLKSKGYEITSHSFTNEVVLQ